MTGDVSAPDSQPAAPPSTSTSPSSSSSSAPPVHHERSVVVSNLAPVLKLSDLLDLFSTIHSQVDVRWHQPPGSAERVCLVSYEHEKHANTALLITGMEIGDRAIRIQKYDAWRQELQPTATPLPAPAQSQSSSPPPPPAATAAAAAVPAPSALPSSVSVYPAALTAAQIAASLAASASASLASSSAAHVDPSFPSATIYVGNLSPLITEAALAAYFSQLGPLVGVQLQSDSTGSNRFGFVQFEDGRVATVALGLHGQMLAGRAMKIGKASSGVGRTGLVLGGVVGGGSSVLTEDEVRARAQQLAETGIAADRVASALAKVAAAQHAIASKLGVPLPAAITPAAAASLTTPTAPAAAALSQADSKPAEPRASRSDSRSRSSSGDRRRAASSSFSRSRRRRSSRSRSRSRSPSSGSSRSRSPSRSRSSSRDRSRSPPRHRRRHKGRSSRDRHRGRDRDRSGSRDRDGRGRHHRPSRRDESGSPSPARDRRGFGSRGGHRTEEAEVGSDRWRAEEAEELPDEKEKGKEAQLATAATVPAAEKSGEPGKEPHRARVGERERSRDREREDRHRSRDHRDRHRGHDDGRRPQSSSSSFSSSRHRRSRWSSDEDDAGYRRQRNDQTTWSRRLKGADSHAGSGLVWDGSAQANTAPLAETAAAPSPASQLTV